MERGRSGGIQFKESTAASRRKQKIAGYQHFCPSYDFGQQSTTQKPAEYLNTQLRSGPYGPLRKKSQTRLPLPGFKPWWLAYRQRPCVVGDTGTVNKLQDEITELQANHDSWVKAGMMDRLERCDPGNRPCVEVNEDAGTFGTPGGTQDYQVLKGY
jgi:hypothetical protein